jgi:hypothetical protein
VFRSWQYLAREKKPMFVPVNPENRQFDQFRDVRYNRHTIGDCANFLSHLNRIFDSKSHLPERLNRTKVLLIGQMTQFVFLLGNVAERRKNKDLVVKDHQFDRLLNILKVEVAKETTGLHYLLNLLNLRLLSD